jgi:hypothetical protein
MAHSKTTATADALGFIWHGIVICQQSDGCSSAVMTMPEKLGFS